MRRRWCRNSLARLGMLVALCYWLFPLTTARASIEEPRLVIDSGGHMGGVRTAFSKDGLRLISIGREKTIRIWDLKSGKTISVLRGQIGDADIGVNHALALSPDDQRVAVGGISMDYIVRVFDLWSGDITQIMRDMNAGRAAIIDIEFSPDGKFLADIPWSNGGKIDIWKSESGEKLRTLDSGRGEGFIVIEFSPDGRWLAGGHSDGTVVLWNVESWESIELLVPEEGPEGSSRAVLSMAFSPDSERLITAASDRRLRVWQIKAKRLERSVGPLALRILFLFISPDGTKVMAGQGQASGYRVFSLSTGAIVDSIETGFLIAISRDWEKVALQVLGTDNINIVATESKEEILTLVGKGRRITNVGFAKDGQSIAWGHANELKYRMSFFQNGRAKITLDPGVPEQDAYLKEIHSIGSVTLSRNDTTLEIRKDGKLLPEKPYGWQAGFTLTPDGRTILRGYGWSYLMALDTDGRLLQKYKGHSAEVHELAPSPDSRLFVSGSNDHTVRLWDIPTGRLLLSIFLGVDKEWVAWIPQGYYTASKNGHRLIGWHVNRGEDKSALYFPASRFSDQFYSPEIVAAYIETRGDIDAAIQLVDLDRRFQEKRTGSLTPDIKQLIQQAIDEASAGLLQSPKTTGDQQNPTLEIFLDEDIPPWLSNQSSLDINGTRLRVLSYEAESQRLKLLGGGKVLDDVFIWGLNVISDGRRSYLFWRQEKTLSKFESPYSKSFAVVAAIDDYDRSGDPKRRGPTGYDKIPGMVANAKKLKRALEQVGFPSTHIFEFYNQNATSEAIENKLKEFWKGGKYSDADRLFFYFGGHGDVEGGEGYLVTYDFDRQRPTLTSILMSDLTNRHFRFTEPEHMLVALDSCSSGLAIPKTLGSETDDKRIDRFRKLARIRSYTKQRARNVLVAATDDRRALWLKGGGIFTSALVSGLEGDADLNRDGLIQFEELAVHVKNAVIDNAALEGFDQVPQSHSATRYGYGQMIFLATQ